MLTISFELVDGQVLLKEACCPRPEPAYEVNPGPVTMRQPVRHLRIVCVHCSRVLVDLSLPTPSAN